NFFGHQLSAHLVEKMPDVPHNLVDGKKIPVAHFGVVLKPDQWILLRDKLANKGITFLIEPYIRFEGQIGEQGTFFILDPAGNGLEFKMFQSDDMIFEHA
ncbi:MAG TPA: glyoxalase, partial [Luteibaculaceae bacterium]|nr:glyoxalase [Luteibaculaceae bacterium]